MMAGGHTHFCDGWNKQAEHPQRSGERGQELGLQASSQEYLVLSGSEFWKDVLSGQLSVQF